MAKISQRYTQISKLKNLLSLLNITAFHKPVI
jgi:hypothetical protein